MLSVTFRLFDGENLTTKVTYTHARVYTVVELNQNAPKRRSGSLLEAGMTYRTSRLDRTMAVGLRSGMEADQLSAVFPTAMCIYATS